MQATALFDSGGTLIYTALLTHAELVPMCCVWIEVVQIGRRTSGEKIVRAIGVVALGITCVLIAECAISEQ